MTRDHPAKAIFVREFHWSRPGTRYGFGACPSSEPQSFPRDFIAAAIKAGAALPVPRKSIAARAAFTTKE